jgi:large subunit ribosomal protein L21
VTVGDHLLVDRIDAVIGETLELEPVLMISDGKGSVASGDATKGAKVVATVIAHRRGPKIRVFKYKPKKRERRTKGFRAVLTELQVDAVLKSGEKFTKTEVPVVKEPKAKTETVEVAKMAEVKTEVKTPAKVAAPKKSAAKPVAKKEEK